jgi:hypothetical protein
MIQYFDIFLDYIYSSSIVTFLVLSILMFYFVLVLVVFFYRYPILGVMHKKERYFIDSLTSGLEGDTNGIALARCVKSRSEHSRELLNVCKNDILCQVTFGLTFLSIVASTSPFIGLFGTVVSILESFAQLGQGDKASLNVIAPVISEALIATAAGILVAIPAYSFHLILKRKAFEIMSLIDTQIDVLILKQNRQNTLSSSHEKEQKEIQKQEMFLDLKTYKKDNVDAIQLG